MKGWKNTIIAILSILLIVSVLYIGYDKVLKKEEPLNNSINSNNQANNQKIDYDFEKLLKEAIELYTPFTIYDYNAQIDNNNCKTIKNQKYCLVINPIFSSKSELENKLTKLFNNQAILHNTITIIGDSKYGWANLYEEIEGKYYKLIDAPMKQWNGANYSNVSVDKVEPIVIDDKRVLLNVSVISEANQFIEGTTEYKTNLFYLLEKNNDNWVFKNFETPMGYIHNNFNETSLSFHNIYAY